MDYKLSGLTPAGVSGGLNGETEGGWAFTADKAAVARPASGGGAWAMGAYEP